jgi:hypothetical protein
MTDAASCTSSRPQRSVLTGWCAQQHGFTKKVSVLRFLRDYRGTSGVLGRLAATGDPGRTSLDTMFEEIAKLEHLLRPGTPARVICRRAAQSHPTLRLVTALLGLGQDGRLSGFRYSVWPSLGLPSTRQARWEARESSAACEARSAASSRTPP